MRQGALYNEIEPFAVEWIRNLVEAGHIAPGVVNGRSIVDLTARSAASFTQAHFFAGIAVWSAAARAAGWPDDAELWSGSCPCFVAGTLILTNRGQVPIEDVVVGDQVMTHRGRWRRVNALMRDRKSTRLLKGQGLHQLETTDEHPFWIGGDEWRAAKEMKGSRWACATRVPVQPIPRLSAKDWIGRDRAPDFGSPGFWRFVGYWLGDGWTRERKSVVICGAIGDVDLLRDIAAGAGLSGGNVVVESATAKLRIGSKRFAMWLDDQFGSRAPTKQIPAWLLGADLDIVRAFVDGFFEADGHHEGPSIRGFTTTSKNVAIGLRILINRLGLGASVQFKKPNRVCVIEGRIVNERGFYRVVEYAHSRSFRIDEHAGWGLVRSSLTGQEEKDVFNVAVEEDESYVADGIIVHNCQPFSSAGRKKGFADDRHLWPVWFDLIREHRPPVIVGEQVASPDGLGWFDVVRADLEAAGYAVGGFDLCAAGIGAPHIRQRLYFVALADGERLERVRLHLRERRSQQAVLEVRRRSEARGVGDAGHDGDRQHARELHRDEGEHDVRSSDGDHASELASGARGMAHGEEVGRGSWRDRDARRRAAIESHRQRAVVGMGDTNDVRSQGRSERRDGSDQRALGAPSLALETADARTELGRVLERRDDGRGTFWSDAEWIACTDGKARPIEPGAFPLAHGARSRVGRLRAYGNAITRPLATTFLEAVIDHLVEP